MTDITDSIKPTDKKIFVNGTIILTNEDDVSIEKMFCLADDSYSEGAEIIDGNLVVDKSNFSPDTWYIAKGGLTALGIYFPTDIEQVFDAFIGAMDDLGKLLLLESVQPDLSITLKKHVYIGFFSAMEVFLCDICQCFISRKDEYYTNYLNAHPSFKDEKIKVCNIFQEYNTIKDKISERIQGTLYHNLWLVKDVFEKTFNITFPSIDGLLSFIQIRHDLVHRNGRTIKGEAVIIDGKKLESLFFEISNLVTNLMGEFRKIS